MIYPRDLNSNSFETTKSERKQCLVRVGKELVKKFETKPWCVGLLALLVCSFVCLGFRRRITHHHLLSPVLELGVEQSK